MIKIYNTLKRKKEILKPLNDKKINLFVCGPTVYDLSHIGHARTYIFFDAFVEYLKYLEYKVFYLQNITDIDDKIIKKAKETGKSPKEIAKKFEKEYKEDMKALLVRSVNKYARATDHIKEIQSQVERLFKKGFAYQIKDGIYFDIKKFKEYGKLSGRTALGADDSVSRVDNAKNKRNKGDFCLWKVSKPGEPFWPFDKFGIKKGRPGWHIEDTAIAEKYFGPQYDIHGGGIDLIFPHHEAEIAQMESISGKKPFVKYWMHTGFLTINGQKMAKSLGNFITIKEFLAKEVAEVLRLFVLTSHYKSPLDYSQKVILQAKETLERINNFKEKIEKNGPKNKIGEFYVLKLNKILENDFNTPEFFAELFEIIKVFNKKENITEKEKNNLRGLFDFIQKVFKIFPSKKKKIPQGVMELILKREKYRKEKNWKMADKIRNKIEKMGYRVEDTPTGPKVRKK